MMKRFGLFVAFGIFVTLFTIGCKPKYPSCKKDAHCQAGEYCVNNQCQQCRDSGDCGPGKECMQGACRDIPGYCKNSGDCASGQICRNNLCGPCMANGDCPDGKVCMSGTCAKAECMTEDDCPAGLSCINYRCQIPETVTSTSSVCDYNPIYFSFDSSDVDTEMRSNIQYNYDCYQKRGGGSIIVEGHCDPRGTAEYNMGLGDRRARIVSKALNTLGIEQSNIRVVSKGKEEATGTDEVSWAKDRKALIK